MLSHYLYSYNVPFLVVINIFLYNTGLHLIVFQPAKTDKIKQRANVWDVGRDQSPASVPGQREICEKITWRDVSGRREFPTSYFQAGALLPRCASLARLLLGAMGLPSFLALQRGVFGDCSDSDVVQVLLPLFSVEGQSWGYEGTLSEGPKIWGLLANTASLDFTFRMTLLSSFRQIHLF